MFDKKMFEPGCFLSREEFFEVYDAPANICYITAFRHILHMTQGETPGIFVKIIERITASLDDPIEIQFHFQQVRVGLFQQKIIGLPALQRLKFKSVI